MCYYNGEATVETDQLRSLRSRVAVLSDKDKAKYQKRKAKVATEESEEDGPLLRKVRSTPTLGHERSPSLVPPVPPLPYFTRSVSKSPIMEPMTPVMMPSLFETPHNGHRSTSDFLHPTEVYGSVPPTPSNYRLPTTTAIQAPVPRRASTGPQAFSFVNYTEEDADELMEAVAPSGGRGAGSPQKNSPQKSLQRKSSVLSSDDEFEPAPTPKPKARARQQSIPARKSSLKTVKSMGNLPRPPSALLLPIATDLVPTAMSPVQTPMSAMVASTTSAPFVDQAPRTLRRYASANFSPSLSTVADVPDQLIDPQLRIGPIPHFPSNAQPHNWGNPSHGAALGDVGAAPPPVSAQAYTFMRPGSPSLYVRIPQASPDVSATIRLGSAGGLSPHGGFPPLPPLPNATLWPGALPSPNPSLPSPITQTVRLSDAVKLDVANDPYLLVTTPIRSPSPAFSFGGQSNIKASDPVLDELLNWHPSPPPTTTSAMDSAPPTPYLSVPGKSGYFKWVPEPGQPSGLLAVPAPAVGEAAGIPQDGLVVQE